jgi:hypothetical protein
MKNENKILKIAKEKVKKFEQKNAGKFIKYLAEFEILKNDELVAILKDNRSFLETYGHQYCENLISDNAKILTILRNRENLTSNIISNEIIYQKYFNQI